MPLQFLVFFSALFGLLPYGTFSSNLSKVTYFNMTDCLAFFVQQISLVDTKNSQVITLPPLQNFDSSRSSCKSDRAVLAFSYKNIKQVGRLDIRLEFSVVRQLWVVSGSSLNLTCSSNTSSCTSVSDGRLSLDWLSASNGFSYKCTNPSVIRIFDATGSPTTAALRFYWFQAQPFGAKGGRFGQAEDCIGFFTIPIWSTLIISFLLVGILTYGLTMLLAVKPFEMYDDPTCKMVQLGSNN